MLVAIVALSLLGGKHGTVAGQAGVVPLIAAVLIGPRRTAAYGVAAIAAVGLLGLDSGSYAASTRTTEIERLVIVTLTAVIAVVISAARVRRELRLRAMTSIAEAAQQALLPLPPPHLGGVTIEAAYVAAASEARIGGDFYDVAETPWGIRVLIGDVRGKGLEAVRMAAVVLGAFRERAGERQELADVAVDLDRAVSRASADSEEFVTATLAEVAGDGGVVRVVLAGHPGPLLVRNGRGQILGRNPVMPLGVGLGSAPPRAFDQALEPGDRLLFYTDGTTEARSERGDLYAFFERAPAIMGADPLKTALEHLLATLREWSGASLCDDAAFLALEIGGDPAEEPAAPMTATLGDGRGPEVAV